MTRKLGRRGASTAFQARSLPPPPPLSFFSRPHYFMPRNEKKKQGMEGPLALDPVRGPGRVTSPRMEALPPSSRRIPPECERGFFQSEEESS